MARHVSWAYRIPAPLVPWVPTKTRLEFIIKKFEPRLIYIFFYLRPPGTGNTCITTADEHSDR